MDINNIVEAFEKINKENPLIHCITNYVTTNDCANVILAIGASPVMADSIYEVEEMVSKASALVLNIGTLEEKTINSMLKAGCFANKMGIPIVLDPVGVAATEYRKKAIFRLLENIEFSVIKGNVSEIKTLYGLESVAKGVDSYEILGREDSKNIAKSLSKELNSIIAITGEIDYISDGKRVVEIKNGNKLLSKVTGTGCMTTSIIGAYLGSGKDNFLSAVSGIITMGIAGEIAFENLKEDEGVGSYRVKIIDGISKISKEDFIKRGKINEEDGL